MTDTSSGTSRVTGRNGHDGPRSLQAVEAELAAARVRLASTVDELAEAVSPQVLARRQADKVRDWFIGPDGVRRDRVAKVAGVVAGLIALRTVVRKRS